MTQRLKGRIRQSGQVVGKVTGADTIVAQTVKLGTSIGLGDLSDVDTTGQSDGVMLRYDNSSGNYEVSTDLNNENLQIIGGTY
jgi:hypothetical protein|tara:strand:- start:774 stop:1022 length:249 start_codon:yes stop_codon:yes gene_type:complete